MIDDEKVIREIAAVSDGDAVRTVQHYLYVSSQDVAARLAEALRQRGFEPEDRLGADGESWLVWAKHDVVPTEELMASTRCSLEALVETLGGEYDGWEAKVRGLDGSGDTFH
jgi:regulator of RNase E activity RraB